MKILHYLFISAFLLFVSPVFGQKALSLDISGTWKGSVSYMSSPALDIYYTIGVEDGHYQAFLSVPSQGIKNFPIDTVTFDGLKILLSEKLMGSSLNGVYTSSGILGTFCQNGLEIPVILTKSEIPLPKRPQEPKPPYPYYAEDVTFRNEKENFELAGTLTTPKGNAPFPAVILVSGSGFQDRNEEIMDHKPFLVIADFLSRNGIAVLRYDDRGVGKSSGIKKGATTEMLSEDALSAYEFLRKREGIGKIGIIGHSEGASIAFLIAARDPDIDFVVSLAGPGANGSEVLISQVEAIAKASGIPHEQAEIALSINSKIYSAIRESSSNDSTLYKRILAISKDESAAVQATDPWFYNFVRFSPEEALSSINVPLLALNGTKDLQVLAELNLPKILEYSKKGGNKNVTVKYLEGLNHLFQHCQSGLPAEYASIEETFSEEALMIIKEWIINQ